MRDLKVAFAKYDLDGIAPEMSFVEMLAYLNQTLVAEGPGAGCL